MRSAAAAAVRRLFAPKPRAVIVVGTTSPTRIPVIASTGVTQPSAVNQTAPAAATSPTTGAPTTIELIASRRSMGRTQSA